MCADYSLHKDFCKMVIDMQINLLELLTNEGKEKKYQVSLEMDSFKMSGNSYKIIKKDMADITVIHLKNRNLSLMGSVDLTLLMMCDRCLDPVEVSLHLMFDKAIDLNVTEGDKTDTMDEQPYIDGHSLDVDRLVCDELFVNLPTKVLCKEGCKGICNKCGANLNRETCNCDRIELDSRMAAISDIFKNFNEEV